MTGQVTHEIISKASGGNTEAFRMIVNCHQAFAYSVSYRFLGNPEDSEDITQEAFIRLWKNLHKYRPDVKLTTWLYRIIANLCLDFLKSTHSRQQKNHTPVEAAFALRSYEQADSELNANELNELIQEAVADLTPKQKAVFILRDLEGLPVEDVCVILSTSAGNVKSNLWHARQQVSEKLKKYYQTTDKIISL